MKTRSELDVLDCIFNRILQGDDVDIEAACKENPKLARQIREGGHELLEFLSAFQKYGPHGETPFFSISSDDYNDWRGRIDLAIPAAISGPCGDLEFNLAAQSQVNAVQPGAQEKPRRQMGIIIDSLVAQIVDKRKATKDAQIMLERIWSDKTAFALYLRSFSIESEVSHVPVYGQTAKKIYGGQSTFKLVSSQPQQEKVVERLQASLAPMPILKVHGPESIYFSDRSLGALDEEWRDVVSKLISAAAVIVIAYNVITPGLDEEIHLIKKLKREDNTFAIRFSDSDEALPFQQITVTETAVLGPNGMVADWGSQLPGSFSKVPPKPRHWWIWGKDRELLWADAHVSNLNGREYAISLLFNQSIDQLMNAASNFIKLESLTRLAICTLEVSRSFKGLGDYQMAAEHARRTLQIPGYQSRDWLLEAAQEWGICRWLMIHRVFDEVNTDRLREVRKEKAINCENSEIQEIMQKMEEMMRPMRADVAQAYQVSQELLPLTATPDQAFRQELLRHMAQTDIKSIGRPESRASVRAAYKSHRDTGPPLFADARFLWRAETIVKQKLSWWQRLRLRETLSNSVYGRAASPLLVDTVIRFLRAQASEDELRLRMITPDAEYEMDRLIDTVRRV